METRGLGAGSYPDAPDNKEKCFKFEFIGSVKGHGYVYAETLEQAKELIQYKDEDVTIENFDFEIEDIIKIEEE